MDTELYEFICAACNEGFDEPRKYEETHGLESEPYEKWEVCPHCAESGYERAFICSYCGQLKPTSQRNIYANADRADGDVCEICDACEIKLEVE